MYVHVETPEITEFADGFPSYWLRSIFGSAVSSQYQVNALANTYVRLVEAALTEYKLGAVALQEFWNVHEHINLGALHRAVSHFESCVSNMHRATRCFRALRRNKERDPLSVALSTDKPRFATDVIADRFRLVRDTLHHVDELVVKRLLQDGQPFALMPDGPEAPHPIESDQTIKKIDRIVIGSHEILFVDLCAWLREMANVAEKILKFDPNVVARPQAAEQIAPS